MAQSQVLLFERATFFRHSACSWAWTKGCVNIASVSRASISKQSQAKSTHCASCSLCKFNDPHVWLAKIPQIMHVHLFMTDNSRRGRSSTICRCMKNWSRIFFSEIYSRQLFAPKTRVCLSFLGGQLKKAGAKRHIKRGRLWRLFEYKCPFFRKGSPKYSPILSWNTFDSVEISARL